MNISKIVKSITANNKRPRDVFHSDHYLRHNQRRQEHLATLGLELANRSVLELGAGIGDHTSFFLDRRCRVVVSDARPTNVEHLRQRFKMCSDTDVRRIDIDQSQVIGLGDSELFDVVYCYGLLYHIGRPAEALRYMAAHCMGILLLELCVSFGAQEALNIVPEAQRNPSQAWTGSGCRPTRSWVFARLRENFEHVYITLTQPWHEEFPIDWSEAGAAAWPPNRLSRAIFVASREALTVSSLTTVMTLYQTR